MDKKIAVARCHEIQLAIRDKEVPRFESIPEIGMAVQLALHIRGLPLIEYEILKLVASTMLGIPRLAEAPHNSDALAGKIGIDRKSFDASVEIGTKGSFLFSRRSRSKTILLNPTYFSENAEVFADHVAKCGANSVQKTLKLIRSAQGWPLSLIEKRGEILGTKVSVDDIQLLKRLAQDGIVKPPTISTAHAGESVFIFTPTPNFVNVSPLKRELHERALAIVSAVRQGQLLPNRYRIRSPGAVLYTLKTELQLRPTSDYAEQYQNLVHLRVAQLVKLEGGYRQLQIIDTPENRESLKIAYQLVQGETPPDLAVDNEAMNAMTGPQEYIESLISSRMLRERETITLSDETAYEVSQLLLEGF